MPQDIVVEIDIDKIDPPSSPLRVQPDDEDISLLANSIQQTGIINPIVVFQKNERYEIIAGHRRYLAAKEAGLEKVLCRVVDADEKKRVGMMLAENLSRKDLSPMEEASIYQEIIDQWKWSVKQLSRVVGKSRAHINKRLELLQLPDDLKLLVHEGRLPIEHSFVLAEIEDPATRDQYTRDVIKRKVSLATLKEWVASLKAAQVMGSSIQAEAIREEALSQPRKTYYTCAICEGAFPIEKMTNFLICKGCALKILEAKADGKNT